MVICTLIGHMCCEKFGTEPNVPCPRIARLKACAFGLQSSTSGQPGKSIFNTARPQPPGHMSHITTPYFLVQGDLSVCRMRRSRMKASLLRWILPTLAGTRSPYRWRLHTLLALAGCNILMEDIGRQEMGFMHTWTRDGLARGERAVLRAPVKSQQSLTDILYTNLKPAPRDASVLE